MLQVSGLKKSYGSRVLFEDVSFTVQGRERVGLVGRNGSGKSTLFKILRGEEDADQGSISIPKSYRLGFLDQHIRFSQDTVLAECETALPAAQKGETYRAESLLFGLGFQATDLARSPQDFSGGYQLRINLVKCLLQEPDLLLLDEPTNYLDILSLQWMRQFLKSFAGEVILITHDRGFMDSVVTHVMGLHRQHLRKIPGSTGKYYEQLNMDEEIYEKTRVNQEKKIKEMQQFVDRFRAKSTKAKQAQSRLKQIEKIMPMMKLSAEDQLGFQFNYKETPAKVLMTVTDLGFGFNPHQPLFSQLSFRVEPEDRIAIVGKNGYGKTTLLNVLAGQLNGQGDIQSHPETTVAYYQQTNKKKLSPTATVYEEVFSENVQLTMSQARAICGAMMFSGDDASKKIQVLSGGEQGRVLLGKVIAKASNLLMLDEPTNHLDMESIAALTEQIADFPGGVIFVSHDENLLNQLATKLIVFKDGNAHVFLGNYEEFLAKEGWGEENTVSTKKSSGERKENKRLRAELVQKRSKETAPLKKKIEELEIEILRLEESLSLENQKLESLALDSPQTQDLFRGIGQIQIQLAQLYQDMDTLIERLDAVEKMYDSELLNL